MSGLQVAWKARDEHRAQQKPSELGPLLDLLSARTVCHVLEIGGMYGGTAWAWSQVARGEVRCIDWFQDGIGQQYTERERCEGKMEYAGEGVVLINADSHLESTREAAGSCSGIGRMSPVWRDFLFIDGDHSYEGVKQDFEMYSPLVARGGLVALHDVSVPQPQLGALHNVIPFWEELKQQYPYVEIFDPTFEPTFGGIGVVFL